MNIIELTSVYLLAFGLCCCNQKSNQKVDCETNTQGTVCADALKIDIYNDPIINCGNFDSEFTRVYTMKKNDSTVIGGVYVKLENDSLFRYLYVINKNDTLYSIKENAFFKKDRIVDIEGADEIYGYTFALKEDDNFTISTWDKNGKCVGDDASIVWDYDDNIMKFLRTP